MVYWQEGVQSLLQSQNCRAKMPATVSVYAAIALIKLDLTPTMHCLTPITTVQSPAFHYQIGTI